SAQGEALKVFNILDGLGIKLLRNSGVEVAIISGRRSEALTKRASDLSITHLYQGREDKIQALTELLARLNLSFKEVAHVGDDLPDLPVIRQAGLGIAVANAYELVKQHADWCTEKKGGEGAVREVCDFIMSAQGTIEHAHQAYLN
ncbi:MAG: HAD hydrolase family protein, partial [Pseudomonadales bacterium]|nr:HAD hydrolase family protein [Pseudomonadales bacterium]